MKVSALNKPAGQSCEHQNADGCGNYANRPSVCRVWYCMWVRDDGRVFTEDERPDQAGVFFTASDPDLDTGRQQVFVHEIEPGSFNRPAAAQVIARIESLIPVQRIAARRPTTPLTVGGKSIVHAA